MDNEHPKLNETFLIFKRKFSFYKTKLRHFESWCIKKSEMNGSAKGDFQSMLKQMLKEIGIPTEKNALVLNGLYSNLYEFESWAIITKVDNNKDKNIKFIDLFNKDTHISKSTMNTYLQALRETPRIGTNNHTSLQLCAMCVFIQFILEGGRGGSDGFGGSENLIQFEKQKYLRMLNHKNKCELQKKKDDEAIRLQKKIHNFNKLSIDDQDEDEIILSPPLNENPIDDWESLCV
jgi:hypothetical protein